MNLFNIGRVFMLHSGQRSKYKIDCDALTSEDWSALANIVAARFGFSAVEGVPKGGLAFAGALRPLERATPVGYPLLIVDDVLTTGRSMEEQRNGRTAIGIVLFSRTMDFPRWIHPIFTMSGFFA